MAVLGLLLNKWASRLWKNFGVYKSGGTSKAKI